MNPNDRIRDVILKYFYDRNVLANCEVGDAGSACSLDVLKRELKETKRLTAEQVTSNLTYLVDRGWVNRIERTSTRSSGPFLKQTFQTHVGPAYIDHGIHTSTSLFYQISARGIDKIEGDSEYKLKKETEGINIHALHSVVQIGDGNVVNQNYVDLHHELTRLREAVVASDLDEEEKWGAAKDIDSIQDQIQKSKPNKTVVESLWKAIERTSKVAGLVELIGKVQPHIHSLIKTLTG